MVARSLAHSGRPAVPPLGSPPPAAAGTGASSSGPGVHHSVIAELERLSQSPHQAFLAQLRKYREVRPWPMPEGYQQRLAPNYLAQVYKSGQTGVEYARKWLRDHGLSGCAPAQEMLSIMEAVDDSIFSDGNDVINSVAFEKLVRRAYGLERAFEHCWKLEDWRRPDGKKSWTSKVQWDLCDRYDLRSQYLRATRVPSADDEAKQAMERDAAFHKYYEKVKSVTGPSAE